MTRFETHCAAEAAVIQPIESNLQHPDSFSEGGNDRDAGRVDEIWDLQCQTMTSPLL